MTITPSTLVSLTSTWFIRPGHEHTVVAALEQLAVAVREGEPETLAYLVHTPLHVEELVSLPPVDPREVLFFEMYASPDAFLAHVNGPLFKAFVAEYGACFVPNANGAPFTFVEFLQRRAGFIRPAAVPAAHPSAVATAPSEPTR